MAVWLAGLDGGLASGALLSQMRQLATYSRPKGRGRRALKEAWVKSTGGTLGNERGVNRQVAVWRVGEKVIFSRKVNFHQEKLKWILTFLIRAHLGGN